MFFKRKELPRDGELVICTVKKILPHAAFVTLDEFEDMEAMLHVSEISSRWVKNIKDHVTEGKKVVCKILQIDLQKRHIDVSLKRVTNSEKTNKLNEEKTATRVEKLIEVIAKKIGEEPHAALQKIGTALIGSFANLNDFYEIVKEEGVSVIDELDLTDKWKHELKTAIQEQLDSISVSMQKEFELSSFAPDGITEIKDTIKEVEDVFQKKGVKLNIIYISSPKYMLNFTSKNYKEGEILLSEITKQIADIADKNGVSVKLE
jgi:translation initiation factor 2 subunit 1